jgi:hypothetical protein
MDRVPKRFPAEGHGSFARDLIPVTHRHLPMVRVLLPLLDGRGRPVRWSTFMSPTEVLASVTWWEVAERAAEDQPGVLDLRPAGGELDDTTAGALAEFVGAGTFNALRWTGYGEAEMGDASHATIYGEEYLLARTDRTELVGGSRLPEFAWDDAGRFAWGTRLYPDSLVLAADLGRIQWAHADPRLDTTIVRPADVFPPSAAD